MAILQWFWTSPALLQVHQHEKTELIVFKKGIVIEKKENEIILLVKTNDFL